MFLHQSDPRRTLTEQLCQDISKDVCVIAYNSKFEKMVINSLATLYPDLAEHLMNIHDIFADLIIPFEDKSYYNKAMQGSYSIKFVLPALFPNEPELDYHNLEDVQNGMEASNTFALMSNMNKEELEKHRTINHVDHPVFLISIPNPKIIQVSLVSILRC